MPSIKWNWVFPVLPPCGYDCIVGNIRTHSERLIVEKIPSTVHQKDPRSLFHFHRFIMVAASSSIIISPSLQYHFERRSVWPRLWVWIYDLLLEKLGIPKTGEEINENTEEGKNKLRVIHGYKRVIL
jgi:hypothetical protein